LYRKAKEALAQWWDRAEVLIAEPDDEGLGSYLSVPASRTFLVSTRYVYAGKGTPLPFELDEE
jgi:hypothetical protein